MSKAPGRLSRLSGLNGFYRLRWSILKRDNFTCQYCGQSAPDVKLEVDHKLAISEGGTDEENNLITSCYACNRGKGGLKQSMIQAKGKPHFVPEYSEPRIIKLLRQHGEMHVSDIIETLGLKEMTVRVKLSIYKKQGRVHNPSPGLWRIGRPLSQTAPEKLRVKPSVKILCPTCAGQKFLEVKQADKVAYKTCPDCEGTGKAS